MSLKGLERIWSRRRRKTAGTLFGFQGLGTHLRGKFAQSCGRLIGCNHCVNDLDRGVNPTLRSFPGSFLPIGAEGVYAESDFTVACLQLARKI